MDEDFGKDDGPGNLDSTSEYDRYGNKKKKAKKKKKRREPMVDDDGICKMHSPFNKENSVFKDWTQDTK